MADDATFEFSSDDELRQLQSTIDKAGEAKASILKGLKAESKGLSDIEMTVRELNAKRDRIRKMQARDRATRLLNRNDPAPMDPEIVLGSRHAALNPVRRRSDWRSTSTPGQMEVEGDPDRKDKEFFPESMAPGKQKALDKNLGRFAIGLEKAGAALSVITPVATGLAAAFLTATSAMGGAAETRKENLTSVGERAQIYARASRVLGLKYDDLASQGAGMPDQEQYLGMLKDITARRQKGGAGLTPDQLNSAASAMSNGAFDGKTVRELMMQNASYMFTGGNNRPFAAGTPADDYNRAKKAATYYTTVSQDVNAAGDMEKEKAAMLEDPVFNDWKAHNPWVSSLPFSRQIRSFQTRSQSRDRMNEFNALPFNPVSGSHYNNQQTPVRQPDIDLQSGGRGRIQIDVNLPRRLPNPRSGNRPGE